MSGSDYESFPTNAFSNNDEHLLSLIVRSAKTPIIVIDADGCLRYANDATEEIYAGQLDLLLGQNISALIELPSFDVHLKDLLQSRALQTETDLIRADGSRIPVWLTLFPVSEKGDTRDAGEKVPTSPVGAAIIVDLTCHKQTLAQTHRQLEELKLLNKVSLALSSSLELEQILSILLEETRATLNAEACSVALLDREKGDLFFLMAEGVGATRVRGTRMPADLGVIGWVVRNGKPLIVPDVSVDPRFFAGIDNLTGERTRSLMCTPMEAHGTVIGAIEAMNKRNGEFNQADLRLFKLIAASAATAICNALLYQEQREAAEAMLRKNQELIDSREQEIRQERLALIDQISAAIRHEVNNPLTGILSLSEWLLKRQDLPENITHDLITIRDQAARIRDIVRRLSDLEDDRTITYLGDRKMIDLSPNSGG